MRKDEDEEPSSQSIFASSSSRTTTIGRSDSSSSAPSLRRLTPNEVCSRRNLEEVKRYVSEVHHGKAEGVVGYVDESDGTTPLHHAVWKGDVDLVRYLLQHGADPEARNAEGSTPLHWAAMNGHVDTARLLLAAGADPRSATLAGETPLHWAAGHAQSPELCKMLLLAGASPLARDQRGWTPLQKARSLALHQLLKTPNTERERQDFEQQMTELRKQCSSPLTPAEQISQLYYERGLLDFTDHIEDGFYDAGRSAEFKPFEELILMESAREVILVDATRDLRLAEIKNKAEALLDEFPHLETKIRMLALFVSNLMGGTQIDDIAAPNEIVRLSDQVIHYVKEVLRSNVVPLGCVTHGVCRHRAVLYKYLCDFCHIPCRLVRGACDSVHHAWNVILLGKKCYLVDIMHDPMAIYPEDSPEAQCYARMGRVSGQLAPIGGVGGSSVRIPSRLVTPHYRYIPLRDFRRAELELYEKLGSGSFGSVYRCSLNGFTCAVKIMSLGDTVTDADNNYYIKQEISILESLRHDNVVTYLGHDMREDSGRRVIHLFMEYFPLSLSSIIKHQREQLKKPLSPTIIRTYALEVAKGMHYLHSLTPPVLHRDIKSSNVLVALDEHGMPKKVKLCDFGVSKLLEGTQVARTMVGTPGWIAPEVMKNSRVGYTDKADVWSYGMFLSELLTLERPKLTPNHAVIPPQVERVLQPLVDLMMACVRADPRDRPSSSDIIFRLSTLIL